MEILDQDNSLEIFLMSLSNKNIKIITAFASGTENIISYLLNNNNKIEIIIGTINSFSSPKFIEFCQSQTTKHINTYVDFRYHKSIHWKLYLIEPDIIIIGSANFTATGVKLLRDTCIVIKDTPTYEEYQEEISKLIKNSKVINSKKESFSRYFDQYINNHSSMQRALNRTRQYDSSSDWLSDDSNQRIPLFIWSSYHSEKTKETAKILLEELEPDLSRNDIRDFSTLDCDEDDFPYKEGDIVLTAKNNGAYINFRSFDRIIHKDGTFYMYELRKKRYNYPFKLDEIKDQLRLKIPDWYEEDISELDRDDIEELLIANN